MKNHTSFPAPWDLKYFQEAAATENLSRAAERLGVGQPGLSLAIKRLETHFNTALFLRRSRGLALTPAGKKLLSRCSRLQEEWDLLLAEMHNSEQELKGHFKLGCHTSVALYALNPFMSEIYTEYPGIQFELVHDLSRIVCERIISGTLDFGFVINPVKHPELVIRKLASDEVCFWGLPSRNKDVLIVDPNLAQSQFLIKREGRQFSRFLYSSSLEVIASLASSGVGAAVLPTRVAETMAPNLKRIKELASFTDDVTFVYRRDLPKTAAVRVVLEKAKEIKI